MQIVLPSRLCVNLLKLLIYCGYALLFIQLIAENMLAILVWLQSCSASINSLGTFALDNLILLSSRFDVCSVTKCIQFQ